jgi:prevent-host-death family protein
MLIVNTVEARRRWSELLKLAEAGNEVLITRRGECVAVMGPPAAAGMPARGPAEIDPKSRSNSREA